MSPTVYGQRLAKNSAALEDPSFKSIGVYVTDYVCALKKRGCPRTVMNIDLVSLLLIGNFDVGSEIYGVRVAEVEREKWRLGVGETGGWDQHRQTWNSNQIDAAYIHFKIKSFPSIEIGNSLHSLL